MATLTVYGLEIPADLGSLDSFRTWVHGLGEGAPQVHYWQGDVRIEMSPQHYHSHAPVVAEINRVLLTLARDLDLGRYYAPPSWITHESCGLSTEPDGFLVLWDTIKAGLARVNPQRETEMLGRPDMALEVVGRGSEKKDLVDLVDAYARAGVREYWTADVRVLPPNLIIRALGADGRFQASSPSSDGWIFSPTWNRQFRLMGVVDRLGLPDVRLEVRP